MRYRTVALLTALLASRVLAQDPGAVLDASELERRGFDYWLGRGVERDLVEAARWLEQAAGAGRPYAAGLLADIYSRGEGVPRDEERARELALRAASLGVAPAQARLGGDAAFAREPRDPLAAVPWLSAAAEQEHPFALYLLGQLYLTGQGVDADGELGWRLVTRAAELGYMPASSEAGRWLLDDNDASSDDVQRGLHFLNRAASAGYGPGAYWLGKLYLTGKHVEYDPALAAQWLTRSNELEFPLATLWLAELYARGLGVEQDATRAAALRDEVLPTLNVRARNEFAWELAVRPDPELRNGALAVSIMEGVTAEWPSPAYLDTLAAAYAEAGRFEDAVRAQQRAVDALPSATSTATRESFAARVELYGSRQPYREAK